MPRSLENSSLLEIINDPEMPALADTLVALVVGEHCADAGQQALMQHVRAAFHALRRN